MESCRLKFGERGDLHTLHGFIQQRDIFAERFRTIERVFAWEDKFKRLLLRFEFHSINHYAMKTIAYSMINLRHFC